jgi:hypothetical protein
MIKKNKTLPANETSQNSGRNTSTAFRLVRGSLDGTPRLCSDSYEAPLTGRLDRVSTRTRHARQGISTIGKSLTRTTPGRTAQPTLFTNSETKVRAFNATTYYFLPSWLHQLPTWKKYRCQILLFATHLRMGGENLSLYAPYRSLFCHRSPSREDTTRTIPHDLGDSALSTRPRPVLDLASTQPRLTIGQQGEKADVAQDSGSFHRIILYVTMVSRDDRPFSGHVATATSTGIDKTSLQRHPGVLASSYPIKG